MNILANSRRKEKLKQQTNRIAESVVARLFEDAEHGPGPRIVAIGSRPHKVTCEDYLSKINTSVMEKLGGTVLDGKILYDELASQLFTDHSTAPHHLTHVGTKEALSLVFHQDA